MIFSPSSVDMMRLRGESYRVKRDDRIHPHYSGNKIRKLYSLFERGDLTHIVSYGGYQSNAMLSMAHFAREKKVPFTYYTKPVPGWVKELKQGNYHDAIKAGMKNIEVIHNKYASAVASLTLRLPDAVVIDQGAATPMAEPGVKNLALELNDYIRENSLKNVLILLPSGTGATSLYLAKHIEPGVEVVTVPCAGDADYLKLQWAKLEPESPRYPTIINTKKKYHFAKPYPELYSMWEELNFAGIVFDMVYAPKTWLAYFENRELFEGKSVIYIHTGGVIGNATQRLRYERKNIC